MSIGSIDALLYRKNRRHPTRLVCIFELISHCLFLKFRESHSWVRVRSKRTPDLHARTRKVETAMNETMTVLAPISHSRPSKKGFPGMRGFYDTWIELFKLER
jgi:hypothetical protein